MQRGPQATRGSQLLVVTPPGADSDLLCGRLRERGYEVSSAPSGVKAVDAALRQPPDVILMDTSLSPMDRWHAVKRLSAEPRTSLIPVLTLSGVGSPAGLQRLLGKIEQVIEGRTASSPRRDLLASVPPGRAAEGDATVEPGGPGIQATGPTAPLPVRVSLPPSTVSVDPAPSRSARPGGRARGADASVSAARLLVVDDNALNRDMLSRRLSRRGYEVDVAEDGRQALDLIAVRDYDLVLLDWMMPGLSGLEVLKQVRKERSRIELPIIMATARTEPDDLVEALEHDANDYVTKPLNFDVVHARVRTQLGLVDAHRQLAASERRYRALLENTGDLILQYQLDGTLVYVSPASRTLFGLEPEEMAARPLYHWVHPIDRRALEEQQNARPTLPPAFTWIARMVRQDEQYIWVEVSCRLVRGDGEPMIFAACRDVTEHIERVVGDEPPLPLAGDIMAHPGWRATADFAPQAGEGALPARADPRKGRGGGGPTYTPPAPEVGPQPASGPATRVVLVSVLDGFDAAVLDGVGGDALVQELAQRLGRLLETRNA